jgi:hypothetical protein
MRDGYRQDVLYLPQVEGPGRLVKAYARLLGGLEAIGCDTAVAWATLTRIAVDCAPSVRTRLIRQLIAQPGAARTSDIAADAEMVTRTASRYLEDLALLKVADHSKESDANNSPDLWAASDWLRKHWPADDDAGKSKTEIYPPAHNTLLRGIETAAQASFGSTAGGRFQSHSDEPALPAAVVPVKAPYRDPWATLPRPPGSAEAADAVVAARRRKSP